MNNETMLLIEELENVIDEAKSEQKHIKKANYTSEFVRSEKYAAQSVIIVNATERILLRLVNLMKEGN